VQLFYQASNISMPKKDELINTIEMFNNNELSSIIQQVKSLFLGTNLTQNLAAINQAISIKGTNKKCAFELVIKSHWV